MPTIFIKPETDQAGKPFRVRLPDKPREFLPAKGARVEKNTYWLRRLRDGSVSAPAVGKAREGAKNKGEKA